MHQALAVCIHLAVTDVKENVDQARKLREQARSKRKEAECLRAFSAEMRKLCKRSVEEIRNQQQDSESSEETTRD